MKYRHCTLGFKITAFILVFVLALLAVGSGVAAVLCVKEEVYSRQEMGVFHQEAYWRAVEDAELVAHVWAQDKFGDPDAAREVYHYNGQTSTHPPQYEGYSNLRFEIYDMQGTLLIGNYSGEKTVAEAENTLCPYYWKWQEEACTVDPAYEDEEPYDAYQYYEQYVESDTQVHVKTYVVEDMQVHDEYYWIRLAAHVIYACRYAFLPVTIVSILSCIYLFCWLLWSAGRRKGEEGVHLSRLDRIPLDLVALAAMIFAAAITDGFYFTDWVVLLFGFAVGAPLAMLCLMSLCTRLKYGHGYWYRQTLCFWCLRWCWNLRKPLMRLYYLLPLAWRWLVIGACIGLIALLGLAGESIFLLTLAILAAMLFFAYVAFSLARLQKEISSFAEGNLDRGVELKYLYGSFRKMGQEISTLGETADRAVAQRLKSERMKTELITNVSHDIKTPLTSIVTYVDLLKNAQDESQRAEYLEVLDRQAQKLKKLTVDLIEVSKAASGAMPVDLQETNIVELVNQAVAEYAAKMEAAKLIMVLRTPEVEPVTLADGRLLWRVLDNLLGNCVKYAQSGTRVYVDVAREEKEVCVTVKNISREELNVPVEELMERFVRGDRSRNTEGSGLGLNIAQNLMDLQHGSLTLEVDGDLFKAVLRLPAEKK